MAYKIWVTPAATTTITVYITYGADPTGETTSGFGFYYALSSDNITYGSDILIAAGQDITTECQSWNISVPQNYYGAFGFKKTSDNSGRYFTGTKLGGTCPAQALDFCGTAGTGDSPYVTSWSTSGGTIYFTIYVNVKAGYIFEAC
jgi:hypothetical protein